MCKAIDTKIFFYFHEKKNIFTRKVFSLNLFLELGNDPYCLKGLLIFWAFSHVTLLTVLPWFSPMRHLSSFSWHFTFAVSSTFWTEFLCSKLHFTILHYSFICVLVVSLVCYCMCSLSVTLWLRSYSSRKWWCHSYTESQLVEGEQALPRSHQSRNRLQS